MAELRDRLRWFLLRVPIEDTHSNKGDGNLGHLGEEHPSGSSAGLESRLWGAICQAVLCSRAPPLAPPPPPPCSFSANPSLSCLRLTSWMLRPLVYSWLLLTAFSRRVLASALAKTELSLRRLTPKPRERGCVGSVSHSYLCWAPVSCCPASEATGPLVGCLPLCQVHTLIL